MGGTGLLFWILLGHPSSLPRVVQTAAMPNALPFLIIASLLNWAAPRVCARASLGLGGVTPDTWGAGWRGSWLPARERDPSPRGAAGGSRGSDRWTETKGRGRADGVRDGGAAGSEPDKGWAARAPYQREQTGRPAGPAARAGRTKARAGGGRGARRLIAQSRCRRGRGRGRGPWGRGAAHNEVCKKLICSATRCSPQSKASGGAGGARRMPPPRPAWDPEAGGGGRGHRTLSSGAFDPASARPVSLGSAAGPLLDLCLQDTMVDSSGASILHPGAAPSGRGRAFLWPGLLAFRSPGPGSIRFADEPRHPETQKGLQGHRL
jgi:hypothetical protein